MKKKMSFILTVSLICMMILSSTVAHATNIDTNSNVSVYTLTKSTSIPFDAPKLLDGIGTVSTKQTIYINGAEYPMYCTFDNSEAALNNISLEAGTLIALLKNTYNLDDFSAETVAEYYDASLEMFDNEQRPDWYTESNSEFQTFRAFYDIYENEGKNELLQSNIAARRITSSEKIALDCELLMLLPYNSYVAAAEENNVSLEPPAEMRTLVNGFDTSLGIAYAKLYAESPNKSEYHYFSNGDCANFASQILENGGVSQVVYDSEYSGWWHKTSTNWLGIKTHTHSRSWTMADTFSRYMGVCATTTSNYTFSTNIVAGDFVAADFDSDGDWDHMGFVTGKQGYLPSDGYYDYQIAQHTSNYLAWASSSTNNWDTIGGDGGGTYARIRRSS